MGRRSQGFTLIELMVAVIVLAIGLLGMATLMMQSLQSSESAYTRSQATLLAYDILDRIRANKVDSDSGYLFPVSHATNNNTDYVLDSLADCPAVDAGNLTGTGSVKAASDLGQWCAQLNTSLPNRLDSSKIEVVGTTCTVTINWQEPNGESGSIEVEAEL